jgi:lytic murein transglycosylase
MRYRKSKASPRLRAIALTLAAGLATLAYGAHADTDLSRWLQLLWPDAQKRGVSRPTFDAALAGVTLDLSLPDLVVPGQRTKEQAEFVSLPATYLPEAQLSRLAEAGRRHLATYKNTLDAIEDKYGVPGNIVIAVWGRETDYGAEVQRHNVVRTLVTQAYLGRRKELFRNELLIALKLIQNGTIKATAMGSYTGAMGHTQFEPSDFEKFAVDGDGDGKIDLDHSIPDALASAAKQLHDYGWKRGKYWGFEVRVPREISCTDASPEIRKSVADWLDLGLKPSAGFRISRDMTDLADQAWLLLPAGTHGPGFLALENFQALRQYDASDLYVLFVGSLADRIAGAPAFTTPWERLQQLSSRDVAEIQTLLNAKNFYSDPVDGRPGSQTRRAIGLYQRAAGVAIDCWPSRNILVHLRGSDVEGSSRP